MRARKRVRGAQLAVVALVMFLAAGCAALPTSGPPHEFGFDVPDREPIGQYGSAPQPGSTPEQLIVDFLRASAAGAFDDYVTAKLYMLPNVAASWRPTAQVMVFPTEEIPEPTEIDQSDDAAQVNLSVPLTATLDDSGTLHELAEQADTELQFDLAQNEDGEWRIANLQDGLVLSQSSFTTGFGQFDLFFASADEQTLVADPRWIPRSQVSSHLAQELLQGPSEKLTGAVLDNVAAGLTLPTRAVETRERTAYVHLEGEAPADRELRRLLLWQFTQTLRQAPNVRDVVVTVGGVELDAEDEPSPPSYALDRIVALMDGNLVLGAPLTPYVVVDAEQLGESPGFPAVGPLSDSPVAWVDQAEDQVEVLISGTAPSQSVPVASATKPSIDRFGNVWTTSGAELVLIPASGEAGPVSAELSGATIRRVVVAPDGARVAFLTGEPGQSVVWVATLVDASGGFAIASAAPENRLSAETVDIAWAGNTTLLALVGGETGAVQLAPIGSFMKEWTAPSGGAWISGTSNTIGVIVQAEDQSAYQRIGPAWTSIGDQLAYIATPG